MCLATWICISSRNDYFKSTLVGNKERRSKLFFFFLNLEEIGAIIIPPCRISEFCNSSRFCIIHYSNCAEAKLLSA